MSLIRLTGNAVLPDAVAPACIEVDASSRTIVSAQETDSPVAPDLLIFPGFIDLHVHAREYPKPADNDPGALQKWESILLKETFRTAGEAAINGGITRFAAMPNDPTAPDGPEGYARKQAQASGSRCPVSLFACITSVSEPWADLLYKIYLDTVRSSINFDDWNDIEIAVSRYSGCRVFFHAEDPEILKRHGNSGPRWQTRPPEAEIVAVEKILNLTSKYGLKTHICHVSTRKAVELIEDYRSTSGEVTCEVTPHHLFFSVTDGEVKAEGTRTIPDPWLLGSNPPIRSEEDRQFLLEALKEGSIDCLATDHAPHTLDDKRNGAPGMPHLDTLGPFVGWLIKDCGFSPLKIAKALSENPGRILLSDLPTSHGKIVPGWGASFTLLNMNQKTRISDGFVGPNRLKTRCGWSPFEGMEFPAAVHSVFINNQYQER
jgi:dihydroorotase